MRRRQPFNRIEEQLEAIPTWRLITEVAIILAGLAIILEPDKSINPAKVIFDSSESIAIVSAVALYFKEIPERKKQKHYEAWQVIDNAKGIGTSYARRRAIEDLYKDGVSFYEIDLPGVDLQGITLSGAFLFKADLSAANLSSADLYNAFLSNANLSSADLSSADLSEINLSNANLFKAKLGNAKLIGANLSEINLSNANLRDADLRRANLKSANLRDADLRRANLKSANLISVNLRNAILISVNLEEIEWNEQTIWPAPEEVAKAKNVPEKLKQHLGIK
ncbi:MAG: pentapeptide repeat-containing protein [Cyanobacteria bacterium P01_C01_bin.69]